MSMRFKRKHLCGDCGATVFVSAKEWGRRSRPRCSKCGCQYLTPVSVGAAEQFTNAGTARKELGSPDPLPKTGREHVALQEAQ